jgi:hypothetical protein
VVQDTSFYGEEDLSALLVIDSVTLAMGLK